MGLGRHDTEYMLPFFVLATDHPLSTGGRKGFFFRVMSYRVHMLEVSIICTYVHRYGI